MTNAQLSALVAVVDTGSFTAAASRLSMTQSGVSRAVSALEATLGVTLLDRGGAFGGAVVPTPVGERVLAHAREVLAGVEAIRQEARASSGAVSGRVRIAALQSIAARVLPGLVSAFAARYPGVTLTLLEGTDDEVTAWTRSRAVDLGTIEGDADDLVGPVLAADEMMALVRSDHPLAALGRGVTFRDLAAHPFVLSRGGCHKLLHRAARASGVRLSPAFEVLEVSTIVAMVDEGLGVSVAPSLSHGRLPSRVLARPLSPALHRQVRLVRPARVTPSPAASAFVDFAGSWRSPPTREASPRA